MKKLIVCMLAIFTVFLATSCKKEKEDVVNPAEAFVGTYDINATLHFGQYGDYQVPSSQEVTISLNGDEGDVKIAVPELLIEVSGHATEDGLTIEPISIPFTLPDNVPLVGGQQVTFNATFPLIQKPENGTSEFTVNLQASVFAATADVVATKR